MDPNFWIPTLFIIFVVACGWRYARYDGKKEGYEEGYKQGREDYE